MVGERKDGTREKGGHGEVKGQTKYPAQMERSPSVIHDFRIKL